MTSAFGIDHEYVAKAHSDAYKAMVWNSDAVGGPHAKGNRKILRRAKLKGQGVGLTAGAAGGAGAGALLAGKGGAKVGAVVGGLTGQMVGDYKGSRRAMKNPNYKPKP